MKKLFINDFGDIPVRVVLCFLFTLTAFFPFLPALISSADTQPTLFMLAITAILLFLISPNFFGSHLKQDFTIIVYVFALLLISFISILLNWFLYGQIVILPRYISFLQFLAALIFGYTNSFYFFKKYANSIFVIYFIFTIIYFLTNGLIENTLIKSRFFSEGKDLASMGRGARTLSPEPSFFAIQMFNLLLIYTLLLEKEGIKKVFNNKKVIFIVSFCLLCSLSGYGFAIFFIILAAFFTRYIIVLFGLAILFNSLIIDLLDGFSNLRGIGLILKVIKYNPLILASTDLSFATRFNSFFAYIDRFKNNLFIGDGFSLFQGGGFISIVASLGLVGFFLILFLLFKIFSTIKSGKLKYLLIFWFFLNLFSGPIGIPAIGIIFGLIIRPINNNEISNLQNE
jgi:hypothetical protein